MDYSNKPALSRRRPGLVWLTAIASLLGCIPVWSAELVVTVRGPQGAPVAGIAVYALPDNPVTQADDASAQIQQVDGQFVPHLSVVQTGTSVSFPNRDSVSHHVYSFSAAKRFQLPLYRGTAHKPVQFDRPGVATLGCNIHDDMLAYVLVVDTPYFGVTNTKGEIRLDLDQSKTARVEIWSPRLTSPPAAQSVNLPADGNAAVTITLEQPPAPASHAGNDELAWGDY